MSKAHGLGLAAVLVAAAGLRLAFYSGLLGMDDHIYIGAAHALRSGTFRPENYQVARIGVVAPLALLGSLTQEHPDLWALFGFACSLGTVALSFAIGTRWFGFRVGLGAACLIAFLPNNAFYASVVHVDVPAVFWTALAFLVWWPDGPWAGCGSRSLLRGFLGGLALGAAYLTRETSLFVVPWLAFWAWRHRPSRGLLLAGMAALALVILAESGLYAAMGLHPLHRYGVGFELGGFLHERYYPDSSALARRLSIEWPSYMLNPLDRGIPGLGLLYILFVASLGVFVRKSTPRVGFLLGWWGVLMTLTWFVPISIRPYMPALIVEARFLEPLAVPTALAVGCAVASLGAARRWAVAALVLHAFVGTAGLVAYHRDATWIVAPAREAARFFEAHRDGPIYVDDRNRALLSVLSRFELEGRLKAYPDGEPEWERGAWLMIEPEGLAYSAHLAGRPAAPYLGPEALDRIAALEFETRLPPRWSLRGALRGERSRESRLRIYRVPP